MQQDIAGLQHRQLAIQEQELELRRTAQEQELELRRRAQQVDLELRRRQLELETELRRLALEHAVANERATNDRLAEADGATLKITHRGQTAAIWLAYPILLGSFTLGVVLVILTVTGVIGPALGGTLGGLFVGAPLLASTAKIIQSFTSRGQL
jgi:hypothetical protein